MIELKIGEHMKKYNQIITKELNRILPYHLLGVVVHSGENSDKIIYLKDGMVVQEKQFYIAKNDSHLY